MISAFNFPVAVWAWNAALALVCGDSVIWKPSEKTPLTALATQALFERAAKTFRRRARKSLASRARRARSGRGAGEGSAHSRRQRHGLDRAWAASLAPVVAARFGKSILELGGNNAMIVAPSAKLDLAVRAILFSAVGTAGQRCTTLRRLFVHDSDLRQARPRAEERLCQTAHRQSAGEGHAGRSADRRRGFREYGTRARMPRATKAARSPAAGAC